VSRLTLGLATAAAFSTVTPCHRPAVMARHEALAC
jgi:hypothetical protein